MNRRLVYSREAVIDLADTKASTRRVWGGAQAKRYVAGLIADIKELRLSALRYPLCDMVQPGLRRKRSAMHHIYYLAFADRIEIVRIMHVRRDPGLHLEFETWRDEEDESRLQEDRSPIQPKPLEAIDEGLANPLVEFDPRSWIDKHYPEE